MFLEHALSLIRKQNSLLMKIIHFSDTHLGYAEGNKTDEFGVNLRESDLYQAFTKVVNEIIELKPDLVIHAGDLFDNPRPTNKAINFVLKEVKKISKLGIPFILISGNHSTPRVRTASSIFEAFGLFDYVYPVHSLEYRKINIGDCAVHCLPHMITEKEMQDVFGALKPDPKADVNIAVAHVGVSAKSNYKMGEFNEQIIPYKSVVDKSGFDYIALGHYHKFIKVDDNAYYSGSIERLSFDDAGQEKGFVVIDIEKGKRSVKFHPIAIREMVRIGPIDCSGLTPPEIVKKVESSAGDKVKDKNVLVILDNLSRKKYVELDFSKLKGITSEAAYIKFTYEWATEAGQAISKTSIGNLATEFESFLSKQKDKDLDKKRLKQMGIDYLSKAMSSESA